MSKLNFAHHFERLNASQMQADRDADRVYSWSLIAGLAFVAVFVAVALTMGVQ